MIASFCNVEIDSYILNGILYALVIGRIYFYEELNQ